MVAELEKKWTVVDVSWQRLPGQPQCTLRLGSSPAIAFNKAMTVQGRLGTFRYVQIFVASPGEFRFRFHNVKGAAGSFDLRAEGNVKQINGRGRVAYIRPLAEKLPWLRELFDRLTRSTQYDVEQVGADSWYVSFKQANITRTRTKPADMAQLAEKQKAKEILRRNDAENAALRKKHGL